MGNTIDGFLERLTAATGEYNKAKVSKLGYIGSVYMDLRPEVARQGGTIRIYYPDVGAYTDQAGNDWTPEDLNPGYVDVTFGQRPGKAILVRDFEQMQTATDIIEQFLEPNFLRAQEYANGAIASLINTTNFNTYSPLQASAFATVGVDDAANAWDLLVDNKVPVSDPMNASLLVHNNVHRNMLADSAWNQESLVGAVIAQSARQGAAEAGSASSLAFNFTRKYDQQAPTGLSGNLTGTVGTTIGSTAVTGASTTFLSSYSVGSRIKFGAETTIYRIKAIASDTAMTLTQPYVAGTTATGKTHQRVTYTGVAMHKYAIALAVRPLELVNDGHIRSRLVMLKGLPVRVMLSYVHLKGGWMLTCDYAMVTKVIRPDFGVIIQS